MRENKRRSNKPFAVMSLSIEDIRQFCMVSTQEERLLSSNRRPVVLLRKKTGDHLSDAVSPNNRYVGVMLPYTPLHELLFTHPIKPGSPVAQSHFKALVMTSGNLAEEPIVRDNDEALEKLSGLVDGFLFHNRDIFMRVDDSVMRVSSVECGKRIDDHSGRNSPSNDSLGVTSHIELSFSAGPAVTPRDRSRFATTDLKCSGSALTSRTPSP